MNQHVPPPRKQAARAAFHSEPTSTKPSPPTCEQLQEIIRHKDRAVSNSYWNTHALWSIAWLAYQAHDSGNVDFSDQKYAEASAYAMKHIAERIKASDSHWGTIWAWLLGGGFAVMRVVMRLIQSGKTR